MIVKDYKEIDGIKLFSEIAASDHQDYNSKGLDNLFAQEEKHFGLLLEKNLFFRI